MHVDPATLLERLGIEHHPRGSRLVAACPSPEHDDHRPSWAAWEDDLGRFRHRCLACGFGGGPAKLVQAVLGLETRAACDFLLGTESAGPPPPPAVRVEVRERRATAAVEMPDEVWLDPFAEWPAPARKYLLDRGLGGAVVARWGLGYVVDGSLRSRVWVPVRESSGRLVAWTARSFVGDDPKYLSSSEPAHGTLLGEQFWHEEGRVKVAAIRGNATVGATIDPTQARKLAQFDEVVVATDPDKAGERAGLLVSGIGRHTRVRIAELPEGKDCARLFEDAPDELLGRLGLFYAGPIGRVAVVVEGPFDAIAVDAATRMRFTEDRSSVAGG